MDERGGAPVRNQRVPGFFIPSLPEALELETRVTPVCLNPYLDEQVKEGPDRRSTRFKQPFCLRALGTLPGLGAGSPRLPV